eukprot:7384493-Prymnesium_polylepis.6
MWCPGESEGQRPAACPAASLIRSRWSGQQSATEAARAAAHSPGRPEVPYRALLCWGASWCWHGARTRPVPSGARTLLRLARWLPPYRRRPRTSALTSRTRGAF